MTNQRLKGGLPTADECSTQGLKCVKDDARSTAVCGCLESADSSSMLSCMSNHSPKTFHLGCCANSPNVIPGRPLAGDGVRLNVAEQPLVDYGVHLCQVDQQRLGSPVCMREGSVRSGRCVYAVECVSNVNTGECVCTSHQLLFERRRSG